MGLRLRSGVEEVAVARRALVRAPRIVRRTWAGALVGLLALALVVSAVLVPGLSVADVRLHDGTVYAVKQDGALLGTVNTSIKDLSSATRLADRNVDVLQEGRTVIVRGTTSNQVQSFDPATGLVSGVVALPSAGDLALNAGKLAVISRTNGSVWFGEAGEMLGRDFTKEKAQLDLGENALATVTTSGRLIGLSLTRSELVRLDGTVVPVPLQLDPTVADVELSAVGEKAVVLDRTKQLIWFEGLDKPREHLILAKSHLAAPIPASRLLDGKLGALVGTPQGMIGVAPKETRSLAKTQQGTAQRPVVVGDCAYGVTGAQLATVCPGKDASVQTIPDLPPSAEATLRVNRDTVILNDSVTGTIWLVADGMRKITEWDRAAPKETTTKEQNPDRDPIKVNADRSTPNRPPKATDDQLMARDGASTYLPVLDNDSDPDGDVLTIAAPPEAGAGVTLSVVRGGTGLQVTVAPGQTGSRSFQYTISDGRGGSDTARVSLTLKPHDQQADNTPPRQLRQDPVLVAAGQQTQIRTLLDWRDNEGDDLFLKSATMLTKGDDEVTFTPDGTVTFTDVNKSLGVKTIQVEVSDGVLSEVGVLTVDVRKPQEVPPVANGDFYTAAVDKEIEVKPLLNDVGANLSLATVDEPMGPKNATRTVDYQARSFRFKAQLPGTYYVGYKVTNGPTSYGLVRIDVIDRSRQNQPPVAARDIALLTHGGSVTIDPLLNDEDPDGDVLVLQSFTTEGLSVEMRDRHLLVIKELTAGSTPVTLRYVVSDGYHPGVTGSITVIPTNPVGEVRPVAARDEVNVRVGDAVTVRPLANDYSPVGLDLTLDPKLVDAPSTAWVDRETIRFVAPSVPGVATATYQVRDSLGRTASAQVRFTVVSPDIGNQPPRPQLVVGRAIAGTRTRVTIPLQNVDPDGDTVRLLGLSTGPRLGRVVSVGSSWIDYEALPGMQGTDAFSYAVTDGLGARAVAEIRVGVVPAAEKNADPTAVDDRVVTRPGRTAYLRPMANDYDIDGDRVTWGPSPNLSMPMPAKVVDDVAVEIAVPNEKKTEFGTYVIQDSRGARATGNITVVSDPEAPLQAPVTTDDMVDPRVVFNRDVVDVPVLANDYDPDGPRSDLRLSIPTYDTGGLPAATVEQTPSGPQLRVPIGDRLRVLRYQVTDGDGLVSYGFVMVPGRSDVVPTLKDPSVVLQVTAGDELRINVGEYVQGTQARKVQVSSADRVIGAPGQGVRLSPYEVVYKPSLTDVGPAAITFEVVEEVDIAEARSATVTIPINVLPRPVKPGDEKNNGKGVEVNTPPSSPPIEIRVGAGDPAAQQNLEAYVVDRQGDAFTFGAFTPTTPMPAGVRVSTQGPIVTASADIAVPKGTRVTLQGTVTDVRGSHSTVTVTVVVLATTKPRTVTGDDLVGDANQGQATSKDVLANDSTALGGPLTIVGTAVEAGSVSDVKVNGSVITVTPAKDFVGTVRIRYTVMDATKDPERNVDGRLVLTVRGRPSPPGAPRQTAVGDQTLSATWTSSLDNGLAIQKYVMTARGSDGSGGSVDCPTTTCTLTGLRNGVKYTVTAVAINQLGASDPSPASAEMMPNVRPDKPAAPRVERVPGREGGKLRITWEPPTNRGTEITDFTLSLVGGDTKTLPRTTTTIDWPGLTNGQSYAFRVAASNAAGTSDVSDAASGTPSEPPKSPPAVRALDAGDANGGKLVVDFDPTPPSQNGGAEVTEYWIYVTPDTGVGLNATPSGVMKAGSLGRQEFPATNGTDYYAFVRAVNVAGASEPPTRVGPVRTFGAPQVKDRPRIEERDAAVQVDVDAVSAGAPVTSWEVRVFRAGREQPVNTVTLAPNKADGGLSATVATNEANDMNARYYVWARPSALNNGVRKDGAFVDSDQVTPYGRPGPPTVTLVTRGTVYPDGSFDMEVKVGGPQNGNGGSDRDFYYYYYDAEGKKHPISLDQTAWVKFPKGGGVVRAVAERDARPNRFVSDEAKVPVQPVITATGAGSATTVVLNYAGSDEAKFEVKGTVAGSTAMESLGSANAKTDKQTPPGYRFETTIPLTKQPAPGSAVTVEVRTKAGGSFTTTYTHP